MCIIMAICAVIIREARTLRCHCTSRNNPLCKFYFILIVTRDMLLSTINVHQIKCASNEHPILFIHANYVEGTRKDEDYANYKEALDAATN